MKDEMTAVLEELQESLRQKHAALEQERDRMFGRKQALDAEAQELWKQSEALENGPLKLLRAEMTTVWSDIRALDHVIAMLSPGATLGEEQR